MIDSAARQSKDKISARNCQKIGFFLREEEKRKLYALIKRR